MVALTVWLTLASAPLADLEVDQLTLTEALAEDMRLSKPPSRVPPATLLGLGLIALPTGVLSTIFVIDHWQRNKPTGLLRSFTEFAYGCTAIATGLIGVAGLVISIVGGVFLSTTSSTAADMEVRRTAVRERIARLSPTQQPDPEQLEALEAEILVAQRPSLGVPAGLLGLGIASMVFGLLSGGVGLQERYWGAVIAGGGEIAIGAAMLTVAVWQFIARGEERDRIDTRLETLGSRERSPTPPPLPPPDVAPPDVSPPPPPPPPPGASLLPPAPVLVSWGFAF